MGEKAKSSSKWGNKPILNLIKHYNQQAFFFPISIDKRTNQSSHPGSFLEKVDNLQEISIIQIYLLLTTIWDYHVEKHSRRGLLCDFVGKLGRNETFGLNFRI